MEVQGALFIGGSPENNYTDYKTWKDLEPTTPDSALPLNFAEMIGYELDVDEELQSLDAYLLKNKITLKEYIALQIVEWGNESDDLTRKQEFDLKVARTILKKFIGLPQPYLREVYAYCVAIRTTGLNVPIEHDEIS